MKAAKAAALTAVMTVALLSCSAPGLGAQPYRLETSFPRLSFTRPVDLQAPRDSSGRLFLVEQQGIVRVFKNQQDVSSSKVFLDIRSRVDSNGNEKGLLGLAFHPDYGANGYFYVNYTASSPNRTVIARFRADPQDPDKADPGSFLEILSFPQPFANHNGGQLAFGPDGYLYIATGDGGSAGDPYGNGQNRAVLLGKILRIDVDSASGGRAYGIPRDNPFAGNRQGLREEIFAYGLRNPWRFSFDPPTGRLWAADVGQDAWEEVDLIVSGGNYGWNTMEGNHCYAIDGCDSAGLAPPIEEFDHREGRSITGGFVYRGSSLPGLVGAYVYADYVSGRIWALRYSGPGQVENELLLDTSLAISSFGVDDAGEIYLLAFDGHIHRLR